jgi:hypothetical protein
MPAACGEVNVLSSPVSSAQTNQESSKHIGQRVTGIEPRNTLRQFRARVPGTHQENRAGKERALHESKDESDRDQLAEALHCTVASRHYSPDSSSNTEVYRRP